MKNKLSKKELLVHMNNYQDALIDIYYIAFGKKSTIGFNSTADEILKKIDDTGISTCSFCSNLILREEKVEKIDCFRYHINCYAELKQEYLEYKKFKAENQISEKIPMKKSSEVGERVV